MDKQRCSLSKIFCVARQFLARIWFLPTRVKASHRSGKGSPKGIRNERKYIIMCTQSECIKVLTENKSYLQSEYGVTGLTLFGSTARGDNRPESDVDILVEMPPKIFLMSALKEYLENILNSSVDLVRRHSHLSPRFLTQIQKDAITIFWRWERKNQFSKPSIMMCPLSLR